MNNPKFRNTENECVKTEDGRTVFLSRSSAVCVVVAAELPSGRRYYLLSQRGENTPDYQYHWNLICGYVDYDETLSEAAIREVWEETGFYIPDVGPNHVVRPITSMPWGISDTPKPNSRQNITHRFEFIFRVSSLNDLPKLTNDNAAKGEVEESAWVDEQTVYLMTPAECKLDLNNHMVWAFNHGHLIREWSAHSNHQK